jgi:predicted nucleotidyltransferase
MTILDEYKKAERDTEIARLRRVMSLRAMLVDGQSQREIAQQFGLTQPAISYQVSPKRTAGVRPSDLIEAGASVMREVAEKLGFTDLSVFGSTSRGEDRVDSDVDLLITPPEGADLFDLIHLEEALSTILGRNVDLVSNRALNPTLDRDILNDRIAL